MKSFAEYLTESATPLEAAHAEHLKSNPDYKKHAASVTYVSSDKKRAWTSMQNINTNKQHDIETSTTATGFKHREVGDNE